MSSSLPWTTRALVVQKDAQERKPVYHDTEVVERPIPSLKQGEILVKIGAAAFNHRDVCASDNFLSLCQLKISVQLWIRKGQYPGITFGNTLGADGAGKHDPSLSMIQKRPQSSLYHSRDSRRLR